MAFSLIKQLTRNITLFALIALVITATGAFYYAFKSAYRLQDDILQQTAQLVSPDEQLSAMALHNRDNRIFIQNHRTSTQVPYYVANLQQLSSGFHSLTRGKQRYRFYVRAVNGVNIATFFDEKEFRDEIALHSAWLATAPLILFVLFIIPFCIWRIRRSLQPIDHLSRSVAARSGNDISELDNHGIASELQGFITALNQLLAKVRESQAQQQRFVADAAHELRSPLTALSLQIERLHTDNLPNSALAQLNTVQQGIARMRHLLEQLLALAKIQSQHAAPQKLSVQASFLSVLETLLPLADKKNVDIGIVSDGDQAIYANSTALYVLLKTICENAINYTPAGGQVDLRWRALPHGVVLQVEDNGIGIAPAERSRVFDPFYRVLGTHQTGTGLGLAIAHTIVQQHNGRIVLSDTPHFTHGLLVSLYLPHPAC
ncbi:HAMP domain-containing histidine kinase [Pasteurellaceae bacterium HPA106]|uniref:sensor histidine kinase n=1 Tax=Spirabiliibacterium pneumoniae TaxID=221400 RepID=UPI001AAD6A60|nr:HAMP domain-containing sensor histidine kinase [Spirabiliibacterium pneumoniae]MBE2897266.1 HAMP domain-containing histidine kinase [Spirabiliibacterium pneumoniae]